MSLAHGFNRIPCVWVVPVLLVACVGYRSPLGARRNQEAANPQSERDAGDSGRPTDPPVDLRPPDEPTGRADVRRPDEPGRAEDARPGDAARNDVVPDLAARDVARDAIPDLVRPDVPKPDPCPPGREYILALGGDSTLYRLDPVALKLTSLAPTSCPSTNPALSSNLNSLTVSPIGPAYISNHAGNLCLVDLATMLTRATPFKPASVNYSSFGMALLPDSSPAGQSLYVAVQSSRNNNYLSRIDLSTYALTGIGTVKPAVPWAELTAGPNGSLYGLAVGDTLSQLLTIDPKTAEALDVVEVPAGYTAASFALVYWGDFFYLFVGEGSTSSRDGGIGGSSVYRYAKGDKEVFPVGVLPVDIIGAGVACSR